MASSVAASRSLRLFSSPARLVKAGEEESGPAAASAPPPAAAFFRCLTSEVMLVTSIEISMLRERYDGGLGTKAK